MSLIMRLTHNSLSTLIAWVSSCLLAGGVSTLFSDSARMIWLIWGCFGLVSAVGLDVAARVREKFRFDELQRVATTRFERELQHAVEETDANLAIREALGRILGGLPPVLQRSGAHRSQERYPCSLDAEILLHRGLTRHSRNHETCTRVAQITNLSDLGFELTLDEQVVPQRATMIIATHDKKRVTMLGEILWCGPQADGKFTAGGRFLHAVSVEAD